MVEARGLNGHEDLPRPGHRIGEVAYDGSGMVAVGG
jgi:hypothetical protein